MRFYNKKQAYTLAEIMLVLLILSIIFAAFAPIFTKRKISSYTSKYNVWEYADRVALDAYYDPGDPSFTGELFFGVTPNGKNDISATYLPFSKLVIRSGEVTSEELVQRQIQFRYGRSSTTDRGTFAGSWLMDGNNALLGGAYRNINENTASGAKYNVAIGYDSLSNINTGKYNTAIGNNALAKISGAERNTAIGYMAGKQATGNDNTFIGASAGSKVSTGSNNTIIGYNATTGTGGSNNIYIGAFSGNNLSNNNVAIGYNALGSITTGSHNVAVGANALSKLTTGSHNVAIGANACSEVTTGSYKTCIGANSGPHSGTEAERYLSGTTNSNQVTYIGGEPNYFGGDAVLEIHNIQNTNIGTSVLANQTSSNTTTVINGNLIVRGRPYFTSGNSLYHFHDMNYISGRSTEHPNYRGYGYGSGSVATDNDYYRKCASSPYSYSFSSGCINLYTSVSDRRLKNIGSKSTDGLNEILKLKVYNYTFKNDPDKKPHVGVIAQDLAKVFPNSVVQGSDGYLRIRWDEMFYATINAIKELDKKIVNITKRLLDVETKIADLEKENATLKSQVDSIAMRINKLKAQ